MRIADAASVCPVLLISRWLYPRPMAAQSLAIREPVSTHPGCCLTDALTGVVATPGDDGVLAQAIKHRLKPVAMSSVFKPFDISTMLNPRSRGPQVRGSVPRHPVLPFRESFREELMLSHERVPRIQRAGPVAATILSSVVAGCASSPGGHAPSGNLPPALAAPAQGATIASGTASEVSNAAAASTSATSDASKAAKADSKLTCHVEVPPGSRVGVRVCETAAQREAREAAVRATRDQLSRPTPGCAQIGPGGCPGGR
jgi:hypothetical protein